MRFQGAPFDAAFFSDVLRERVKQQCQGEPDNVPVVWLQLADGRVFDVCHIAQFAAVWMAVFYYRDTTTCEEMDLVFLPYGLATTVRVSLHHKARRPAGFDVSKVGKDLMIGPTRQLLAKEQALSQAASPGKSNVKG
jgi:hypothetical protein